MQTFFPLDGPRWAGAAAVRGAAGARIMRSSPVGAPGTSERQEVLLQTDCEELTHGHLYLKPLQHGQFRDSGNQSSLLVLLGALAGLRGAIDGETGAGAEVPPAEQPV